MIKMTEVPVAGLSWPQRILHSRPSITHILAWVSGLPTGLGERTLFLFRFHFSPFPQKRLILRLPYLNWKRSLALKYVEKIISVLLSSFRPIFFISSRDKWSKFQFSYEIEQFGKNGESFIGCQRPRQVFSFLLHNGHNTMLFLRFQSSRFSCKNSWR